MSRDGVPRDRSAGRRKMVAAWEHHTRAQKHEREFSCGGKEPPVTFHSRCGRVSTGLAMSIDIAKGGNTQSVVHISTHIKTPGRSPFVLTHCGKIFVRVGQGGGGFCGP